MQNYVENCGVHFFCFRTEKTLLGKSAQKNQNCQFKVKFCSNANVNMQNSMVMFLVSAFEHKYLSWANLVQKFTIVESEI